MTDAERTPRPCDAMIVALGMANKLRLGLWRLYVPGRGCRWLWVQSQSLRPRLGPALLRPRAAPARFAPGPEYKRLGWAGRTTLQRIHGDSPGRIEYSSASRRPIGA